MKAEKVIRTEIVIRASKEVVWKILTDTNKYKEWNPFIISMEGEIKSGSTLINKMKNGDGTMKFKPKVLKVVPFEYFEWLGSLFIPGLFDGRHYFKIEDAGEGYVKLLHGETFSGIFSSYILRKIGEDTRGNFIKMNQALKDRAESGLN